MHTHLRVMDYDTYSANDAIGRVYLDLSPLLSRRDGPAQIGGWLPIYDTMHGIFSNKTHTIHSHIKYLLQVLGANFTFVLKLIYSQT